MVAFAGVSSNAIGAAGGLGQMAKSAAPMADDAVILAMRRKNTRKHQVADTAVVATKGPDAVDKGLGLAERATSYASMLPFIAGPLAFVGKGVSKVGGWTKFGLLEKAGQKMGAPSAYLSQELGETALAKPIGAVAGTIANTTAGVVGGVSRFTGYDKFQQRRYTAKAEKALGKARDIFEGVPLEEAPAAVRGHVKEMQGIVNNASGTLSSHQVGRLEELMKRTEKGLAEHGMKKDAEAVSKAFTKPFNKAAKRLGQVVSHHNGAAHWQDVEKGIRNVPNKLNNMHAGNVVMNGAFATGSAVSMATDAKSFGHNIASLKSMYKDLTGKEISTIGLFTKPMPKVIADSRNKLVKTLFVKEGADVLSMGLSLKELTNPHFSGAKSFVGFTAAGMVGGNAERLIGETPIAAYEEMKANFKPGQQMPPDYYAAFLGEMNPELQKRGGAESPFTQELAKQYASVQATPQQVLNDLETGGMQKRIDALIADQKKQAQQKVAPVKKELPVVGRHTEKVVQQQAVNKESPANGHAVT